MFWRSGGADLNGCLITIVYDSEARNMNLLVTGVCGQLGYDVVNEGAGRGHRITGSDIRSEYSGIADGAAVTAVPYIQLDISDETAVRDVFRRYRPDAVIHCAAWTAVDAAEESDNRAKVHAINAEGTENIARAAKEFQAKMLYISTDYVFGGQGERPWKPDDECYMPLNVYGQSKLDGELAVRKLLSKYFIVRTSWVFGMNGKNFIRTMINLGKKKDSVRVVNDQIGTPTYSRDLARLLIDMIETEKYGCYHATNEGGYISWYELCTECYRQYGLRTQVIPVTTEEYGLTKAVRPKNSRLDKSKLTEAGFQPLPDWNDAVRRYLEEAKP